MESRTYRPGGLVLVFGLGFTLIPLFFILPGLYGLLFGAEIPFKNRGESAHAATTGELLLLVLFPMIHLTIGVLVLLYWFNSRIIVDEAGVVGRDWRGRTNFQATWREITGLHIEADKDGDSGYKLQAGEQTLSLLDRKCYDEIAKELKWRAPQLKLPG